MPFGPVEGVAPGADIKIIDAAASVRPTVPSVLSGAAIALFMTPPQGC